MKNQKEILLLINLKDGCKQITDLNRPFARSKMFAWFFRNILKAVPFLAIRSKMFVVARKASSKDEAFQLYSPSARYIAFRAVKRRIEYHCSKGAISLCGIAAKYHISRKGNISPRPRRDFIKKRDEFIKRRLLTCFNWPQNITIPN